MRKLVRGWKLWAFAAAAGVAVWVVASAGHEEAGRWAAAQRRDLVVAAEVTGELQAEESEQLGPPQINEIWNYKISFLIPEGSEVQAGMPVLRFDTTELQQRLQQVEADRDSAAKTLEKRETDLDIELRNERLALAEAEARLRKAVLESEIPADVTAADELREAMIDKDLAALEIDYRRQRLQHLEKSRDAEIAALVEQRDRAIARVEEVTRQMRQMTVQAPRAGTVTYVTNWRGEKKKVGDSCWRGEMILAIPNLEKMLAEGTVEEAKAGRVAVGQAVRLRLDAYPDEEWSGRVEGIRQTVQPKSWRDPRKVVRLTIALDETDPERMRPGMRFQGEIEVERIANALVVPLAAVVPGPGGAVVRVAAAFGDREVVPELGRSNGELAEVLGGIEEGDRVLVGGGG